MWLFWGFVLSGIAQLGFITINFLSLDDTTNRWIGEASVAFRAFPIFCIMAGMFYLYKAIVKFKNGNGNGR